ncbi:hypothetical protein CTN06_21565 [Pectobacterium zantedeschiae]|uniref:DUF6895 domain-containing protein n=2 Tax=Pectobacterium zantedeschiae TaxID=2034769 RepID=A0A9X8P6V8_9GAMM|nr:hypothetical protein CTN06_21565 [Pectobacterium zantedeschiae]RYC45971.1 hypothetical protein CLR69_13735 [Pectobacterium zantedeschiae]
MNHGIDMTLLFSGNKQKETFLEGLIYWITKNLESFTPPKENTLLDIHPELIESGINRKAFGELGLALRILERVPSLWQRNEIKSIREAWLDMAVENHIFFDATRRTRLFPLMVVSLSVIQAINSENTSYIQDVKRTLQIVMDRGFMDRIERSAWQKTDLKYYIDSLGLSHSFPSDVDLLRQSSLLLPPSIFYSTRMDLYGITHLIFHLSDFGLKKILPLTSVEMNTVKEYVTLAMQLCLFEQDYDLTAELIISSLYLQETNLTEQRAAIGRLVAAQHHDGFMPDKSWLIQQETHSDEVFNEFLAVYHPTLVSLILVASDTHQHYYR